MKKIKALRNVNIFYHGEKHYICIGRTLPDDEIKITSKDLEIFSDSSAFEKVTESKKQNKK